MRRRVGRFLLGLLVLVVGAFLSVSEPASAAQVANGTADSMGFAGYCNVDESQKFFVYNGQQASFEIFMTCNISAALQTQLKNTTSGGTGSSGTVTFSGANGWSLPAGSQASGYTCNQTADAASEPQAWQLSGPQVLDIQYCGYLTSGSQGVIPSVGSYTESSYSSWSAAPYVQGSFNATGIFGGNGMNGMFVESVTQESGSKAVQPQQPGDYFQGGTAGLPAAPAPSSVTCGRVLHQGSGTVGQSGWSGIADFSGSAKGTAGESLSYSWSYGDGSAATASASAAASSYTYSGAQPAGGWTATLTVTATGDNVTYKGTATATCRLRVDWNYPDQTTAGTTGAAPPSSGGTDCPSGWGWLDPTNILNMLKCLFVPSSDSLSGWSSVWSTAQTTFPFSLVSEIGSYLSNAVEGIQSRVESSDNGVSASFQSRGCWAGNGGPAEAAPSNPTNPYGIGYDPGVDCAGASSGGYGGIATGMRVILVVVVFVSGALGIWRLVSKAIQ